MEKNELLELIAECGGNTAELVDRSKKNLIKELWRAAAENPVATVVPVAENVPYAEGEAPTKAEFDGLIDALIECGLMKAAEAETEGE